MAKNIQIIVSSTRAGRFAPNLVTWIEDQVSASSDINLEVVDLKDVDLSFFTEAMSPMYQPIDTEEATGWSKIVNKADGFIFLTPEYNRSIPAALKNAIDYLYNEWLEKPAAIISYGYIDGGKGASGHLQDILEYLKMTVADKPIQIQLSPDMFDESGKVKDPATTFAPYESDLQGAVEHVATHELASSAQTA